MVLQLIFIWLKKNRGIEVKQMEQNVDVNVDEDE